MRCMIKSIAIIIIFTALMVATTFAQTNWTKYLGNPVMDVGPPGSWDDEDVKVLIVVNDGSLYHMWYTGNSGGRNTWRVGYATSNDGISWIFFLLFVVFLGDTGAFYTGSYLGRHKLCPAVSPNKTIEGSVGGLVANVCAGAVFKIFFFPQLNWHLSILFFLCIGVAGQVGDLFESKLKRVANIKDSGSLLPGHGGILDRIDALLFAAPVAYFFKEYLL